MKIRIKVNDGFESFLVALSTLFLLVGSFHCCLTWLSPTYGWGSIGISIVVSIVLANLWISMFEKREVKRTD